MSKELEQVTTYVESALALLPQQFKNKENLAAFIEAFVNVIQDAEDALFALWRARWIDNAEGVQLDGLGDLVGEERGGLDDDAFRVRIKVRIRANFASGTDQDIVDVFALLLSQATPTIEITEYYPAGLIVQVTTFVDTDPNVMARTLKDVRAAGVDTQLIYHVAEETEAFRTSAAASPTIDSARGFAAVDGTIGSLWYNRTFGGSSYISKVVYGAGVWVAIAGTTIKYSTDLKTWNTITITGVSGVYYDLIYAGGKFVAICNSTGSTYKSATSTDGISWTLRNSVGTPSAGVGTPAWGAGIAYGGGNYVIMSTVGDISHSTDGETWVFDASAVGGGDQNFALAYVNNRFMAGTTNGSAFESTTGALGTWNLIAGLAFGTFPDDNLYGFAYHNGLYIAYGDTGHLYTSPTLAVWTQRTITNWSGGTIRHAYSDGTAIVVVGAGGEIARSTNGTTWTRVADIGSAEFRGVTKGGGIWAAAGDAGIIATSADGISWSQKESGGDDFGDATQLIQGADPCIDYLGSRFVAWGANARLTTSQDYSSYGGKLTGVLVA